MAIENLILEFLFAMDNHGQSPASQEKDVNFVVDDRRLTMSDVLLLPYGKLA